MRFLCLEYLNTHHDDSLRSLPHALPSQFAVRQAGFDEQRRVFHQQLRQNGHAVASELVTGPESALTVQIVAGSLTAEQVSSDRSGNDLVGMVVLEARDLNHALTLISSHPCLSGRYNGCVEVHACQ